MSDNTPNKTSHNSARHRGAHEKQRSPFRHPGVYFPWLKPAIIGAIGVVAIFHLGCTTSQQIVETKEDTYSQIRIAPMSRHVQAFERNLEGKKLVALTFDDGPSSNTTPRLLDVLSQKDVRATFFMLGKMAQNNPDIVKRAMNEHHEVGSHTMSHQNLVRLPINAVRDDVNTSNAVFDSILGHKPDLVRSPYGNVNNDVRTVLDMPIILWSVDAEDWKSKNVNSILSTTMEQVHDGAIILMHDIYPTSVDAVSEIIDKLREDGYEFVTIHEMAEERHTTLEAGKVYYNFRP